MLTPSSPDTSADNSPSDVDDNSAGHSTDTADNHWMTNLPAAPVSAPSSARESAPVAESPSAPSLAAPASAAPSLEQAAETQPIIEATAFAATEAPAPAAPNEDFAPTANSEVHVDDKPRPFGESAQSNENFGGSPYHFSSDAHSETHDAVIDEFHQSTQSASGQQASSDYSASATVSEGLNAEAETEAQPEPITSSAADFSPALSHDASPDVLHAPADAPLNGGGLSGMLPAEPLFGSVPLHDAGNYSPRDEDEAPPQADPREQEAFAEDTHPGQLPQPAPNEEYWDREAAAHEEAILAQSGASLFAETAAEAPALHSFDRIPTLPPPNREALSEIPFLMPPVLPLQTSEQPAARATDAEAVDNMVRKVMEKLGPHLQELLSQGVKPLVENLLQNELHKKER